MAADHLYKPRQLGGIFLAGADLVVGAYAGAAIETSLCEPGGGLDLCGVAGTLLGGFVGEAFGLALGTHLGNARRGNFGLDVLTSFAAAGAGIGVVASRDAPDPEPVVIGAAVLLQLASTVAVELLSGRSRALGRDVAVFIKPQRDARLALGASLRL